MGLSYLTLAVFLLLCSMGAAAEIEKLGDFNYEFSQSERSCQPLMHVKLH